MDIWVRSQDKTAVYKVSGLRLEGGPVIHSIVALVNDRPVVVGRFSNRELAESVIQDFDRHVCLEHDNIVERLAHPANFIGLKERSVFAIPGNVTVTEQILNEIFGRKGKEDGYMDHKPR